MGITFADGAISGNLKAREYRFLVDTGSTWVTLPQPEIDDLGLERIRDQIAQIETAIGMIERPFYRAHGILEGVPFYTRIVPARRAMIGYELLQELQFVVDLVQERIVRRSQTGLAHH